MFVYEFFSFVERGWKQVGATVFSVKSKRLYSIISAVAACAIGPSVATSSTDFSFQNLFFGIYSNFQWQKSLLNQYVCDKISCILNPNLTK
jgi:hypothetical protein